MNTSSEFSSRSRSTMEFLRRTVIYLRPYRWAAAGNIVLAFLTIGFYFVFPYVTQYIIDTVIGGRKMDLLLPAALCLLGTFLLCEFCNALRIIVNTHFGQNVIFDMRRDVYARLQRLPVNFFDHRASGDLMTRVIDDVASVHRVLIDGVERTATTFLSIIVILIILLFKNVTLTMLALIPLAILVAGTLWYTLTAHRRYRKQREAIGAMNALLMDNLQGVRQIKAFGRQGHEDERFRERADGLRRSTLSVMKVWAAYSPAMTFAGSLGIGLKLKNQPNFERLDRRFRFEIAAGWNFKYDEEAAFRAGVNTRPEKDLSIGADLECRMFGRRRAQIDMRLFTNIGRAVAIRPFVGLRNSPSLSGIGSSDAFKFVAGICLYRWL